MTSLGLCIAAFVFSYLAGRRSLVTGLASVFVVGYLYGILRANVPETLSHFVFDAAVVGLYLTQLTKKVSAEEQRRQQVLRFWVGFLIAWPLVLFLVPVQSYAVQLVGLRGNVFLLPFILLGARLKDEEVYRLTLALAALNLVAFAFAGAEFFFGVERFFPQNAVTELIYRSVIDEDFTNPDRATSLRIPSTFTGAHAYAGMMVMTLVFLVGAWVQRRGRRPWHQQLLSAAIVASILAVFVAGARTPVVTLAAVLGTVALSGRLKSHGWALWLVMLGGVFWIVSSEDRLQRFMTLKDVDFVSERVSWSVNESFWELVGEYPMGNGLGGGGTSMPYFLQSEIEAPVFYMENEYARIVLEQGVLGLCLWAAFIIWLFSRRAARKSDDWYLGKQLVRVSSAAFFATGMIGKGLLTSIPGTALLLLSVGWLAVRAPRRAEAHAPLAPHEDEPAGAAPSGRYGEGLLSQ